MIERACCYLCVASFAALDQGNLVRGFDASRRVSTHDFRLPSQHKGSCSRHQPNIYRDVWHSTTGNSCKNLNFSWRQYQSNKDEMDPPSEISYARTVFFGGVTAAVSAAVAFPALSPHVLYLIVSNAGYLWRRAALRRTSMFDIFRIRTTLEPGVSLRFFGLYLLAWQVLVLVYPLTETVAWFFGYASFFYSYPNAKGGGYILEPLSVQNLPGNKRAKEQLRLDWHRFKYNRGRVGRDGFKHPPSVERNLPHVDIPKKQVKHWPWRRRHGVQQ